MDLLFKKFNLETGLLTGVVLIVLGLAISIFALAYWQKAKFGPLAPSISLRFIILGVTLLTLGSQIILASFFFSILGLKHR